MSWAILAAWLPAKMAGSIQSAPTTPWNPRLHIPVVNPGPRNRPVKFPALALSNTFKSIMLPSSRYSPPNQPLTRPSTSTVWE